MAEPAGKIALRLPKSLHRRAALLAQLDGASLNQWLLTAIADHCGTLHAAEKKAKRKRRGVQHG